MQNPDINMKRGLAQVMRNYGEGRVFQYGNFDISMKTKPWSDVDKVDDIDRERIANIVEDYVSRYKNRSTSEEWENISADTIDLFSPQSIEAEVFPVVFYCENEKCRRVYSHERPEYLSGDGPEHGVCEECGSNITQLKYVCVCECGKLRDASYGNGCDDHKYEHIVLNKKQKEVSTWVYECGVCGEEIDDLRDYCGVCGEMSGPTLVGNSKVFYSENAVKVDVPYVGVNAEDLPSSVEWAHVLIAVHLDEDNLGDDTIESLATKQGKIDVYDDLIEKHDKGVVEDILESMDMDIHGTETLKEKTSHTIPPDATATSSAYSNVAHELFVFQRSTKGYNGDEKRINGTRHPKSTSLSDKLSDSSFVDRHPQAKRYKNKLEELNIRGAWVVDNFPLLNILYGYTRKDVDSTNVDLNRFSHPRNRGTIPIFVDRTPSEAIIFEIDRTAIINWLEKNKIITPDEKPDMSSERELKKWFIKNIHTTELENPFKQIDDEKTKYVYGLLHTINHCLLARAGEQCGLSTQSLSERIFPPIPAVTIYAASTENFSLGGMFTLFKTQLHPWLSDAKELANDCLIDSTCRESDSGAACDACVHIQETSCEYANYALDRKFLRGKSEFEGFWDENVKNNI